MTSLAAEISHSDCNRTRKFLKMNKSLGNEDQDWEKQRKKEMSKAKLRKTHGTKKRKQGNKRKERQKERRIENWELFSVKVAGLYIMTYKWRFSNHFSVASCSVALRYDTFKMTIILILTTSRIWNLTYLRMWPSATHLPNPYKGFFAQDQYSLTAG